MLPMKGSALEGLKMAITRFVEDSLSEKNVDYETERKGFGRITLERIKHLEPAEAEEFGAWLRLVELKVLGSTLQKMESTGMLVDIEGRYEMDNSFSIPLSMLNSEAGREIFEENVAVYTSGRGIDWILSLPENSEWDYRAPGNKTVHLKKTGTEIQNSVELFHLTAKKGETRNMADERKRKELKAEVLRAGKILTDLIQLDMTIYHGPAELRGIEGHQLATCILPMLAYF